MQKTIIINILVLSVFTANVTAKIQMLDVIHLTDGSVVVGKITEIIPNQTVILQTDVIDNSYRRFFFLKKRNGEEFLRRLIHRKYQMIYPLKQIEEMSIIEVKFRNRTTATVRAALFPIFPSGLLTVGLPILTGWGQFYNGQYSKGLGFLSLSAISFTAVLVDLSANTPKPGDSFFDNMTAAVGVGVVIGSYIWSIIDANLSAKKINQSSNQKIEALKQKKHQSQDAPTSLNLNYIPHQGLMVSYGLRF